MKNTILFAGLFALGIPVAAQQLETIDDINGQAKLIDNNKAIKTYKRSLQLHDTANNPATYSYEYVADSVTGNLIKAVIKDDRYNVTRTYYFVNERLIKLYEKKIDQNGMTGTKSSWFRDNSYSITNTGQSEVYDDKGTSTPKRKSALEDAYILLMHFRDVRKK